jgi:hypothetical protein
MPPGAVTKGFFLGRRAARATAVAGLSILAVATMAGLVRVLPWLAAPAVPVRVVVPFARGLLAMGLETALLAAPPLGWAFAAAVLVERGEARALLAAGMSPVAIVRTTLGPALCFAAFAAVAALAWGTEAAAPGRLARDLLTQSKRTCLTATEPRAVQVPVVGVTWLCNPGEAPRVVGALPGSARGAFSALDLGVGDDLRNVELSDLKLMFPSAVPVRVHAKTAGVTGLSPWGRASNLRPSVRALLLSSTGAALALLVALIVLGGGHSSRVVALALGGAGPAAALMVFSVLERRTHGALVYWAVPGAAAASVVAIVALVGALRRLLPPRRFEG